MSQSSLQRVCRTIVLESHGALGCALVDLETGLPLAFEVSAAGILSSDAMELIAAGTAAQFKRLGASAGGGEIREMQTATDDAFFFVARVPGESDQLAVLVLDRAATNLGFGWTAMRKAMSDIEAAGHDAWDQDPADGDAGGHDPATDPASGFSEHDAGEVSPSPIGTVHVPSAGGAPLPTTRGPSNPARDGSTRRSIRG